MTGSRIDLPIQVRDAREDDIPALTAIKGAGSESVHRDRLRDAQDPGFRYFVLQAGHEIIGYGCLVFRRPSHWSDASDTAHLPQVVDLRVKDDQQGQGYGTAFLHAIEDIAAAAQAEEIYLTVEPKDNPRAYALYRRLDYHPIQREPHHKAWEFIDSAGKVHCGESWVVDMVKRL